MVAACLYGRLINAGADPHVQGPGWRTPLTHAVSGGAPWEVIERPKPRSGGPARATARKCCASYGNQ